VSTFLSTPITVPRETLSTDEWAAYCSVIREILNALRSGGSTDAFCALELEGWGVEVPTPGAAVIRDYAAMKRADMFVCLYWLTNARSTLVEIGWAWCLDIPIVIGVRGDAPLPTLVEGFVELGRAIVVRAEDPVGLVRSVLEAVRAARTKL